MAADHLEVEDTYDVPDDAALTGLDTIPSVASVTGPQEHELEATYFDTAGLALAASGVSVRRRTGGDDDGWHLKLPTKRGRYEVHEPLGRAVRTVPQALRAALRASTRDDDLVPLATIRAHRAVHRLLDADGDVMAQISDDRVTAQLHRGHEVAPRGWREWEIELVDGDDSLLVAAAGRLLDLGAVPAGSRSKLLRALGPHTPQPRRRRVVDRHGSARDVVAARVARLVDEFSMYDPLVRRDAPDAVHKMRTTTRRLRDALATFRPMLDRTVTDPLREDLRWLAGRLGEVRDAEVMHRRLLRELDREPADLVRGGARRLVERELGARHRQAHRRCVEAMGTDRYLGLLDRLGVLAAEPPWRDSLDQPDRAWLGGRVRHDWKRLARRVAALEHGSDEQDRFIRLHEARKAAKRVRYAAETLAPTHGAAAGRLAKAVKRVQSALGDHQDSVVARAQLRRLADAAGEDGEDGFRLGVLFGREEQRAARALERFGLAWRRASRKKLRKRLS